MKFSVFTASTPDWTPSEAAQTLAEQGWDGIEWRVVDDRTEDGSSGFWAGNRSTWQFSGIADRVGEIARITEAAGLGYSGIGGYQPVSDHEGTETMLRVTSELGARQVRVTMPWYRREQERTGATYPQLFDRTRADLEWAAGRAAELGVKALVELHHMTITPSASAALRLVDGLDPEHVGVIHDLGNLVIEGQEDHLAAFELLGPYLAHAHVKNARWVDTGETRADGSSTWRNEWAPLRTGQASVSEYLDALRQVGYDGWVTIEDFSTDLPLAARTADNLAYLRSLVPVTA
ncbi:MULTISPECIES: sugar phosphate isomerase/epimerase [unclassified Curtobacterium]|uniref:sugar phosphate isomerase/epimerase family protein n=1 Tax=unclassified Curtobacterium TaxID=257496 RepID=UPI0008DD40C3|nr:MULTISPECIES: sugar phosphate isomerase/epimerase family protein [unclassified Curtobacterium]OIH93977.1 xylose isomerase [Curtobacterium sp. MCBA15_003]OII33415.1 xylose isomerase [Curtobacterium sp. MMLR14_006]